MVENARGIQTATAETAVASGLSRDAENAARKWSLNTF